MKKVSALIFSGATYLSLATHALGAGTGEIEVDPCPLTNADTTSGSFNLLCQVRLGQNLFQTLITTAFIVASLIALAFLIYGGVKWILSGGDKAGVETARNIIVAALVGLVITFLAYLFINIVFQFFGLGDFGTFTIPSLSLTDGAGAPPPNN